MPRKLLLAAAMLAFAAGAFAQQWPSKPVRVIVNVAPGGVADITARVLGARLQEALGQPFVIENRPGGDGYIGFEPVARADPDGYTLVYAPGSTVMIAPHLVNRPDLDPVKALVPVAPTGSVSLYVMTHPDFPDVPTLEENGIKGVDGGPYFGFYTTAGTPREPVERMNRAVAKAMQDPVVHERFKALAVDLADPMSPEQFAAYVRAEYQRYAKLIPELGIAR
jgi:tripartite-type tricarboxylate transporter receptor subunit TctC